jgi:hypothetical protein
MAPPEQPASHDEPEEHENEEREPESKAPRPIPPVIVGIRIGIPRHCLDRLAALRLDLGHDLLSQAVRNPCVVRDDSGNDAQEQKTHNGRATEARTMSVHI